MATANFDKWSACLKGSHSIFNVFVATLLLLIFELENPSSPFAGGLFNIQIFMAASFLYYVIMLAIMISAGIQITSPFRCFLFELVVESIFSLTQSLLQYFCVNEHHNLFMFSYIALFFINSTLHLTLRSRIKAHISQQEQFFRALPKAKLSRTQIQKIQSELCSICLSDYSGEQAMIALPCGPETRHIFHLECVQQWFRQCKLCPLCRGSQFVSKLLQPLKKRRPNVTVLPL